MKRLFLLIGFVLVITLPLSADDFPVKALNGFDLQDTLIDARQISRGGPPRDGIPALDNPAFISAQHAEYLSDNDRILGYSHNGEHRAYPIRLLNWHEIVNDRVGGQDVIITYCPLCGTGMAFESLLDKQVLEFGVSGLLYNSDVLLYDRETESLWSQIRMQAVSGPFKGKKLKLLPLTHTRWSDWKQQHPDTRVLSPDTGHARDYNSNPYQGYDRNAGLYFRVEHQAPNRFHPKQRVLGIEIDNHFKAYAFSELEKTGQSIIEDRFQDQLIRIHWDPENQRASRIDEKGQVLAAVEGFWFAWYAFHPDTEVYEAS